MDSVRKCKYTAVVIAVIFAIVLAVLPMGTAFAMEQHAYALHNGVPVYADTTLGTVEIRLEQNQKVEVLSEEDICGKTYFKVSVNSVTGYVNADYVYFMSDVPQDSIKSMQVKTDKIGRPVKVYAQPDLSSAVIDELSDGTNVNIVESDSEFCVIVLDDGIGYIRSENVTNGLSRNQTVALIVGVVTIAAIIVILALLYYRKNKEHFASRRK